MSLNEFLLIVLIASTVIAAGCWCVLRFYYRPRHRRFQAYLDEIRREEGRPPIIMRQEDGSK